MIKRLILSVFILSLFSQVIAQTQNTSLYIYEGEISFHPLGLNGFPFLCFNSSDSFSARNGFVEVEPNTTLNLTIVNRDASPHTIHYEPGQQSTGQILPGDSALISLQLNNIGMYRVYDSLESNRYLGLSTFIKVWPQTTKSFVWHLNELQSDLNEKITMGIPYNLDSFNPDYFTINDNTHPDISTDSVAKVIGNIGDSIYIFVFNSGKMHHAIHFHGYHVTILESSSDSLDIGRSKDSIPIRPGTYQVYLLVPHQEGKYPVHDHNLVATTGGGNYPNGMMVMMEIDP